MANNDILLCRCEDLTKEALYQVIEDYGCTTIDEIKRVTRAGMGPCQGRTCRILIAQELSNYYHVPMEEILMTNFRPPAKPLYMGTLADAYKEGDR